MAREGETWSALVQKRAALPLAMEGRDAWAYVTSHGLQHPFFALPMQPRMSIRPPQQPLDPPKVHGGRLPLVDVS